MSLPTITVIGNVQKIDLRQAGGKNVASVTVACGEKNSKGNWDNLYIKAEFWEKQHDFVTRYFKEGDPIIVTGRLVTTNYTNGQGQKIYETKFLFPQASFVPKAKDEAPAQNNSYSQPAQSHPAPAAHQPAQAQPQHRVPEVDINEDEIPF